MSSGLISVEAKPAPARPLPGRPISFAGAVTGIGSLPFHTTTDAMRAIVRHCGEIPFWPQLPRLSDREGVIGQGLGVIADHVEPRSGGYGYEVKTGKIDAVVAALHRSSGCLTSANAAGFAAFLETLSGGAFDSAMAVKGQIEGPITLATYLFYRDRSFLADESLFAAVAFHISQIVCWQIDRLKSFGRPVVIFVDEPALCLNEAIAPGIRQERRLSALSSVLDDARARGAIGGLHCCAARPFERMCAAKPDILSFDAHQGLDQFFACPDAADFIRRGGSVAYGLIPTSAAAETLSAGAIFNRWLMAASIAGDPQALARRALVTATCGLGLMNPQHVAGSFDLANRVGALIKRLAGFEG